MGNHRDSGGYRYSYSGADCKAFAFRNNETYGTNQTKLFLESLQTISFSIHEAKGQARALGHKNVKGFSRSIRQIAGTMIFTVIEDHPLAGLMKRSTPGWSVDGGGHGTFQLGDRDTNYQRVANKIATLLAPFDIMLVYATERVGVRGSGIVKKETLSSDVVDSSGAALENSYSRYADFDTQGASVGNFTMSAELKSQYYPQAAGLVLAGIEIITEGIVTSVNDMITEIQIQFVARDAKELSLDQFVVESNDITYDEAYEILKNEYEKTSLWQNHEAALSYYELQLEYETQGMDAAAFYSAYPGVEYNFTSDLEENEDGTGFIYKSRTTQTNFVNRQVPSVTYNPETEEYVLTVATVNNPILFDD